LTLTTSGEGNTLHTIPLDELAEVLYDKRADNCSDYLLIKLQAFQGRSQGVHYS